MHKGKSSPLAQILKEYRAKYNITQEQLASELSIDSRTLRRYENSGNALTDIHELRRIASALGIESERLGVLPDSNPIDSSEEVLQRIWALVFDARAYEARNIAGQLVTSLSSPSVAHQGSSNHLMAMIRANHALAYTQAMSTRSSDIALPLASYERMEQIAKQLNDKEMIALSLTYIGDMHNRTGNANLAREYITSALDITSIENVAARGNALQLLGRAYFKLQDNNGFDIAMSEAEELASQLTDNAITRKQYGLKSVYEEYSKSYALQGNIQEALKYIELANRVPPHDMHWKIVLLTTEVMALIRGGELEEGTTRALEAIKLCKQYGTTRLLERIYGMQRYFTQRSKQIGNAGNTLREALDGPIEF